MEPMTTHTFVLKSGKWWTLTQRAFDEFVENYPQHDVEAEIRKMVIWCKYNVRRRKTAKGMNRFIVNWLNRAEEIGYITERPENRCYLCKKVGFTSLGIVAGKTCKVRLCDGCKRKLPRYRRLMA